MLELAVEAACLFSRTIARVRLSADSSTRDAISILIAQEVVFGLRLKKFWDEGSSSLTASVAEDRGRCCKSCSWTFSGPCSFL